MGTLANSEDPDEMPHNTIFYDQTTFKKQITKFFCQ